MPAIGYRRAMVAGLPRWFSPTVAALLAATFALSLGALLVLLAVALVVLNGFFVAAEFSLVKLRSTRAQELSTQRGWRGRILGKVHGKLDTYLSACQLGITLSSPRRRFLSSS